MIRSRDRILTTLAGSLPRPDDLVTLLLAQDEGDHDPGALGDRVRQAVADVVAQQVDAGIDIVSDGEMSKISYVNYLKHRLDGFGGEADLPWSVQDHCGAPGLRRNPRRAAREAAERWAARLHRPACSQGPQPLG